MRPPPDAERSPVTLDVAAFTGGTDVPSARFRVRQYLPALRAAGIDVRELPARAGTYPPLGRSKRAAWALRNVSSRLVDLARARGAALSLLQREFLSSRLTL